MQEEMTSDLYTRTYHMLMNLFVVLFIFGFCMTFFCRSDYIYYRQLQDTNKTLETGVININSDVSQTGKLRKEVPNE